MSLSKKRAQKSLNHSTLSQISNTQNLRDSSLFKNDVLAQIRNVHLQSESKYSKKEQMQQNTNKKRIPTQRAQQINSKSKQCDRLKQNKVVNYVGLSKILDQRNILINNQQKQIQNLKSSLQRVRKQLQLTRIQFQKKKLQDMTCLKRQQRQNQQNIKQLQILRVGMRQLKSKMEAVQHQKQHLHKKTTQYLKQNEQLTIKLTSLKQQYLQKLPDEKTLADLKHQLCVMKEQSKLAKQMEVQKIALEERCRNFERKINDYIVRYNEVQADHNEAQIKYYRAQKQNDDLKMNIEQLQMANKNIRKMLEEEKKILGEQTERWKSRIARLQDHQRGDKNTSQYNQTRTVLHELQDRFSKLEQSSMLQQRIQEKNKQISMLNTRMAQQQGQVQSVKYQLCKNIQAHRQIESSLSNTIANMKQTYEIERQRMATQVQVLESTIANAKQKGQDQRAKYQQYKSKYEQCKNKCQQYKTKYEQCKNKYEQYKNKCQQYKTKYEQCKNKYEQCKLKQQQHKQVQQEYAQSSNKHTLQYTQLAQQYEQCRHQYTQLLQKHQQSTNQYTQLKQQYTQLKQQYTQLKHTHEQQIREYKQRMQEQQEQVAHLSSTHSQHMAIEQRSSSQISTYAQQHKQQQDTIAALHSTIRENQMNAELLANRNSALDADIRHSAQLIAVKDSQIQQHRLLISKYKQQHKHRQEQLQAQNNQLTIQLNLLHTQLELSSQQSHSKQMSILHKLSTLQTNILHMHKKQQEFVDKINTLTTQLSTKLAQISMMQAVMSNTNAELKEIKTKVQAYKQQIDSHNHSMAQADRKLDNQLHMNKQAELKWEEELKYYKAKYQDNFRHNIELSDKVCEFQRQVTEQINKNTQIMKTNSLLQSQIQRYHQNRAQAQTKVQRDMEILGNENNGLRDKLQRVQGQNDNIANRLKQTDIIKRQLQNKCTLLNQQIRKTKQQHINSTNLLKQIHLQQLQQISLKNTQNIRQTQQLQQFKYEKQLKTQIQHEQSIVFKLEQASKEIQQKDKIIQQNYQIIFKKQRQIENMINYKNIIESQQIRKIKQYNIKLSQQVQEITSQFNRNHQQLRDMSEQSQKYRSTINTLERDINNLQNRNIQLGNQINLLKCQKYQQLQQNNRNISQLKFQVSSYQQKLRVQIEQTSIWVRKYECSDRQLRKIQDQCNKVSRSLLEESTRKNKQNNREIDNYRTQILVLKEENTNLQKVMDRELGKRKSIIEELIHQKKMLYEQIGHR